jgi:hypothetical protein
VHADEYADQHAHAGKHADQHATQHAKQYAVRNADPNEHAHCNRVTLTDGHFSADANSRVFRVYSCSGAQGGSQQRDFSD